MSAFPRRLNLLFGIGLALISIIGVWFGARSVASATEAAPVSPAAASSPAAPTEAGLHNPTFDNDDWYEFDRRYQSAYPDGCWLPDDDNNQYDQIPESSRQDWRLWFLNGTVPIRTNSTDSINPALAHQMEAVLTWTTWDGKYLAGLYQPIYNTTPCLTYKFQMYGQSRPDESNDDLVALQVGIDRVGWHPDSRNDPAVHSFPDTTVWGPSHKYIWTYGPLTVTAEALATSITVFTYGDAGGGSSHHILWDTGSFQDVTPERIYDPEGPSIPSSIDRPNVSVGSDSAAVGWTTASEALGQVYYRLKPVEPISPTEPLSFTVYLPLVVGVPAPWQATALNKTPTTAHYATLTGLLPGRSYDLVVASRGLSGGQCVIWVSEEQTFTTNP